MDALELVGINKSDVRISNTDVFDNASNKLLFRGEDISDLFAEIVSDAGIYTERY